MLGLNPFRETPRPLYASPRTAIETALCLKMGTESLLLPPTPKTWPTSVRHPYLVYNGTSLGGLTLILLLAH